MQIFHVLKLLIFSGNLTYEDTANSITYNLVPFVFLIIAFFLFRICKYILSDIFANHLKMFHLNFHAKITVILLVS